MPNHLLEFERSDPDLPYLPYLVRYKLDLAQIKLHLKEWQQLDVSSKKMLVDHPCESSSEIKDYQMFVTKLIQKMGNQPTQLTGRDSFNALPPRLTEQLEHLKLTHFQKYVLAKLLSKNDFEKIHLVLEEWKLEDITL